MKSEAKHVPCPYCEQATVFTDSSEVYRKSYGMIYLCRDCDAFVGVHGSTVNPLGTPAKRKLRELRKCCHGTLDYYWRTKQVTRSALYSWMMTVMQLPKERAHIAMLSETECLNLLYHAQEVTPEKINEAAKREKG